MSKYFSIYMTKFKFRWDYNERKSINKSLFINIEAIYWKYLHVYKNNMRWMLFIESLYKMTKFTCYIKNVHTKTINFTVKP
jgi:hypothetical protein